MNAQALLFPHTCRLMKATSTENAVGQPVRTYSQRADGVACHYQPAGVRERAGRYAARVDRARLWLPVGTDFDLTDRIENISADMGKTFEIAGAATWHGSHIELELEAIGA